MDYIAFCRQFYATTGIPTVLYQDGVLRYSALSELLGLEPQDSWPVYDPDRNPEFAAINPDLEYGHVRLEGRGVDLFLGPVFTAPVTEKLLHEYYEETKTPPAYQEAMAELICGIPINSHARFVRLLLLLHLIFNGKEAKVEDFYAEEEQNEASRSQRLTETAIDAKENEESRSSYAFEKELYHHIQQGDPKRLQRFLEQTRSFPSEGKLAHTPLRQAKNTLIGLASKVCVLAAIPGGLDAERAYQLSDLYTLECEQMQTIEDVHRLQRSLRRGQAPQGRIGGDLPLHDLYPEPHQHAHRRRGCGGGDPPQQFLPHAALQGGTGHERGRLYHQMQAAGGLRSACLR